MEDDCENFLIPKTADDIKKYSEDSRIINFCKKYYKYLPTNDVKKLIIFIMEGRCHFTREDLTTSKKFYQYNMGKFDKNNNYEIKNEEWQHIFKELNKFISIILIKEDDFLQGLKKGDITNEEDTYWIDKACVYSSYRKLIVDENGDCKILYDFDNDNMLLEEVEYKQTLQKVKINIIDNGTQIPFDLRYKYYCPRCGTTTYKKVYEVKSTKNKIYCEGRFPYTNSNNEPKEKLCSTLLEPDTDTTISVKDCYLYSIIYEKKGKYYNGQAISFSSKRTGNYEIVCFVITANNKIPTFYIVDSKKLITNNFIIPEQKKDENYLFTLQKNIDEFIFNQANIKMYGLNCIKCSLILQKLVNILKKQLKFNVMIVGDPSTGKSMLFKYYCFMLYNYSNLATNGLSISIAGLRGTRAIINVFGKDTKIITPGHLGTYNSIHIDETGETKELIDNLKSFLLEDNYSYDKAGGTNTTNKRIAHINISQNLNNEHVGQYRGSIRKAYKDINIAIDGKEKEDWNEDWDLFQPLYKYNNPQLRKCIRDKRIELGKKPVWWIDGLDYALHERFPFYFYLVTAKQSLELNKIIKTNAVTKQITENMELIKVLYNTNLDDFFDTLKEYEYCEEDFNATDKIDEIIKQYQLEINDPRIKIIYYTVVQLSRIINKRKHYEQMDYDLVKWFLENTNVKLDVADTNNYNVVGPPDIEEDKKNIIKEEEGTTTVFSLPEDEFK